MKQVIIKENGRIDVVTSNGLSLTEVSSETQVKNGTVILSLKCEDKEYLFGSYRSGMIRKLPSKSSRMDRSYQINRVEKVKKNYFWNGKKYPGIHHKRILITDGLDRLQYLMEYIDRNYGYFMLPNGFVELMSVKELRILKEDRVLNVLQTS